LGKGLAVAENEAVTFFESLVALLALAIVLLQIARRTIIPYPAMLAAAGVGLAFIPGAPRIALDPEMALALFIAPALVDAAFDFPVAAVWRLWRPLFALAVVAVVLSASAVAWLGVAMAGLPVYAALALGAIVAPPDAAAATAILGSISMPRRTVAVLKGESLLNDASALLLFTAATSIQSHGALDFPLGLRLALAVPGGIVLGILIAKFLAKVMPWMSGTLGGNLMEFVGCIGTWIIATRLGLSAVLCLVAFAMSIARWAAMAIRPRVRIHSFAVWETAVFLSNVLAFLLMGLQARTIIGSMGPERLREAAVFALAVVACLICVRMAWVLLYNRLAARFPAMRGDATPASLRHGVLVGWCGMRGLVTLATAFALPDNFPQRDLIVLTAFAVVLATLVVQGLTLAPLVKMLGLDGEDGLAEELATARSDMAGAALAMLEKKQGEAAEHWRWGLQTLQAAAQKPPNCGPLNEKRRLGLAAMRRQRQRLEEMRTGLRIGADAFLVLQEELDFAEVGLTSESERHIEET
jgi:monovalent cation/hydrogen antiporter